ncbi:MAG TPA: phosphodiester glycosidase family protein [Gemmatimonadales bacterium]|nr:phosphodiester glycosidase family protein [Gemmatimonadales bacterium]
MLAAGAFLPREEGALAVLTRRGWQRWYDAAHAPAAWPAPLPLVAEAVTWRPAGPGLALGSLRLSGAGEAWRVGVVLLRIDPDSVRWALAWGMAEGDRKAWTIAAAPDSAQFAVNAGMFNGSGPFGWTVIDGVERRTIGSGALAPAFVVDTAGRAALVPAESLQARRARRDVALAFQSYPELLRDDGGVPRMLRAGAAAIDLEHRDARLALGHRRDGQWLLVLTRFEGAGGALSFLPFGLTVPEMAALMGALGCDRAVSLDGGVSAQLAVHDPAEGWIRWRGVRKVALGLVGYPRAGSAVPPAAARP